MNSLTDKEINRASDGIDKALSTATRSNRGEVAFRILSVVRNLNDHIAFKIWKDVRPDQKMDINKVASKFGNVRPYSLLRGLIIFCVHQFLTLPLQKRALSV